MKCHGCAQRSARGGRFLFGERVRGRGRAWARRGACQDRDRNRDQEGAVPRTLPLLSSPSCDPGLTPASPDLCLQENVFWPHGAAEASGPRFSTEKMTRGRPRPAEDGLPAPA